MVRRVWYSLRTKTLPPWCKRWNSLDRIPPPPQSLGGNDENGGNDVVQLADGDPSFLVEMVWYSWRSENLPPSWKWWKWYFYGSLRAVVAA